ncbi:DNA segregation ATPase, FtsK/SpoIIIE family (fragment) [Candidatus Desulfosporosinus infrequens]|uniref:DNA segregation ATPase, FtsK/SpoIIIE family n=1 Tax=Candidatus Desulfosporosinus infrequens TaxID=2043169 RepID=A0A2U3LQ78_9FIRM
MPGRLAYKVASSIDSQVILDRPGAESLTGMGDLLLLGPSDPEPIRAQGPLVTDEEIERVVAFWRKNSSTEVKNDVVSFTDSLNETPRDNLKEIRLVKQLPSKNIQTHTDDVINLPSNYDLDNKESMVKVPEIPNIPEVFIVEGKRGHMVNLGIPPKPKALNMKDNAWAVLYGYSVRIVVRDQAPRREYLKTLLNIKTDVAQSLMQFMEARKIISPYKGPNSPRQIFISMEQVEKVFSESTFSMHKYTDLIQVK